MKIEYKDYSWRKCSLFYKLSIDVDFEETKCLRYDKREYDKVLIYINNRNEAEITFFKNYSIVTKGIYPYDEKFKTYVNQLIWRNGYEN